MRNTRQLTDDDCIARAQRGDATAFAELVRRFQDRVFRFLLRLTRTREDAQDLTQETFMHAYEALPRWRPDAQFSTWLLRIARNLAYDMLRRSQRVDFSRPAAPTTRVAFYLDDERQRRVEQVYARHIGPMARVLIRKTLPGAVDAQGFCSALAAHLDQESARRQLLAELSQALAPD